MILLAAIPDLLTAAAFLLVWLRTDLAGPQWVANGVATMLLEFFVLNAGGFYAVIVYGGGSRGRRSLYLAGLATLYLLMIAAWAWGMQAWWMIGAFFWLSLGKVLGLWTRKAAADRDRQQMAAMAGWALGVACYLGAVGASVTVDWPAFGVTPEVREAAGFTGGGEWETQPYRALAGGAIYFGAIGVLRTLIRLVLLSRRAGDAAAAI